MSLESELESQISRDTKIVEKGKALKRLLNSSDFRSVIINGFLREYALYLVYQRAESTEDGDKVARKIDAVAEFKAYLDKVLSDATTAEKTVSEASNELLSIRNNEEEA